jgi:dUTPase
MRKLLILKKDGLTLPSKANEHDAAYDIVATTDGNIVTEKGDIITKPIEDDPVLYRAITYIEYGTNLFLAPDDRVANSEGQLCEFSGPLTHLEIFPRSSISKYNLVLANSVGTIDTGYRAEVKVRFKYIFQPKDLIVHRERDNFELVGRLDTTKIYQKGDKIAQLKTRANSRIDFEIVDELPAIDSRGLGGFGSSGK